MDCKFELETGQFYTTAMMLTVAADTLYFFTKHPSYRIFAYILFNPFPSNLKVFPAIFVVMFVDDWRDWKGNLSGVLPRLAL